MRRFVDAAGSTVACADAETLMQANRNKGVSNDDTQKLDFPEFQFAMELVAKKLGVDLGSISDWPQIM